MGLPAGFASAPLELLALFPAVIGCNLPPWYLYFIKFVAIGGVVVSTINSVHFAPVTGCNIDSSALPPPPSAGACDMKSLSSNRIVG